MVVQDWPFGLARWAALPRPGERLGVVLIADRILRAVSPIAEEMCCATIDEISLRRKSS